MGYAIGDTVKVMKDELNPKEGSLVGKVGKVIAVPEASTGSAMVKVLFPEANLPIGMYENEIQIVPQVGDQVVGRVGDTDEPFEGLVDYVWKSLDEFTLVGDDQVHLFDEIQIVNGKEVI